MNKKNLVIIIFNILMTLLLFLLVRSHVEIFVFSYIVLLLISYILLLILFKNEYISKFTITFHTIYTLVSSICIILLTNFDIFVFSDGWNGLNSLFIMMVYFFIQSCFIGVLLLTNFLKDLLKKKKANNC